MRERVGGPVRLVLAMAIGVGLYGGGKHLIDQFMQPPQEVLASTPQKAKLPVVAVQEPTSLVEFIPVFDEVFSALERAGFKTALPIEPKSYALNRFGVSFSRGAPNYMNYKLTKSDFPGWHLLRTVKISPNKNEIASVSYQFMDNHHSSPNTMDLSEDRWQALGRIITRHYNSFAKEYDGTVDLVIPGIKSA